MADQSEWNTTATGTERAEPGGWTCRVACTRRDPPEEFAWEVLLEGQRLSRGLDDKERLAQLHADAALLLEQNYRRYSPLAEALRVEARRRLELYMERMAAVVEGLEANNTVGSVTPLRTSNYLVDHDDIGGRWLNHFADEPAKEGKSIRFYEPLTSVDYAIGARSNIVADLPRTPKLLAQLCAFVVEQASPKKRDAVLEAFIDALLEEEVLFDVEFDIEQTAREDLEAKPEAQALARRMAAALERRAELVRGLGRTNEAHEGGSR